MNMKKYSIEQKCKIQKQLDVHGYVIIKNLFDHEDINDCKNDTMIKYNRNDYDKYGGSRIQDTWKKVDLAGIFAYNPKILQLLKFIYKKNALPFQTLYFKRGSEQPLHTDMIHFNSIPSGNVCVAWIAFENITMDNGPVIFYPGSHKFPFKEMEDLGFGPGKENYGLYSSYLKNKVKDIEPHYGLLNKGDMMLWDGNLVHGGSKIRTTSTRYCLLIDYFFTGCKYYTPLLSTRKNIVYRNKNDFIDEKFEEMAINYKRKNKIIYKGNDIENIKKELEKVRKERDELLEWKKKVINLIENE